MYILHQQDVQGAYAIMKQTFDILEAVPEPYLPFVRRGLPYLVAVPKKTEGKYASVQ